MDTLIVAVSDGVVCGFGEVPIIDYYGVTAEGVEGFLKRAADGLDSGTAGAVEDEDKPSSVFGMCGLEEAYFDYCARRDGQPLREWLAVQLGLVAGEVGRSCYTLGHDSLEVMVGKLRECSGFDLYKVKVTGEDDLKVLEALRGETGAGFRVDANGGLNADEAVGMMGRLAELGVEMLEQPLARGHEGEMHAVKEAARGLGIAVVADESCRSAEDVACCEDGFDGVNIKLTKCGGYSGAIGVLKAARERGMGVMIGCMTETTVGISAAAQLAPFADWLDLDGALLLAEDVAKGVQILEDGRVEFPDSTGTGVELL